MSSRVAALLCAAVMLEVILMSAPSRRRSRLQQIRTLAMLVKFND